MPKAAHAVSAAVLALSGLLVASTIPAAAYDAPGAVVAMPGGPGAPSLDLAAALDATGTFRGVPGLTGSVDAAGWVLVSDLAAGEAPRFARAAATDARARSAGGARKARRTGPAVVAGWSAVGGAPGSPELNQQVTVLTAKASRVYLGGDFFSLPDDGNADSLAEWDNTDYAAIGTTNNILNATVNAIAIDGSDLYVGGAFQNAAGIASADRVAKWDGGTSTWVSMGGTLNATVRAIAVSGADVYVGGDFTNANGIAAADYIARWDGSWHALGSHNGNGSLADHVNAIAISGTNVYVGGLFTNADGIATADYVVRWDGAWNAMGSRAAGTNGALSDQVYALLVVGRDVYTGGNFTNAADIPAADYLASWRGGAWHSVGPDSVLGARVHALAAVGDELYVGGHFLDAAGIPEADRVVRWDGSDWSALGSDGAGDGAIADTVLALAVFDSDLYVGGVFEDAAGISEADYLARWQLPDTQRPDGRVRQGTSGSFTGGDIYNTNGKHQQVNVQAGGGTWITFQVSLQNDSATSVDTFRVDADGAGNGDFIVKYLQGAAVITTDVEAGTYVTPAVAIGNDRRIKVRIKVKASASVGEKLTRTIRITSVTDPSQVDVVKVIAQRQ